MFESRDFIRLHGEETYWEYLSFLVKLYQVENSEENLGYVGKELRKLPFPPFGLTTYECYLNIVFPEHITLACQEIYNCSYAEATKQMFGEYAYHVALLKEVRGSFHLHLLSIMKSLRSHFLSLSFQISIFC